VRQRSIPPTSPGPVSRSTSITKSPAAALVRPGHPVIISSGVRRVRTSSSSETTTTSKRTVKTTTKSASGATKETESTTTKKSKDKKAFSQVFVSCTCKTKHYVQWIILGSVQLVNRVFVIYFNIWYMYSNHNWFM
jgi:hypothetical protein